VLRLRWNAQRVRRRVCVRSADLLDFPAGTCGQQSDGCGSLTVSCGGCPTGQFCSGARSLWQRLDLHQPAVQAGEVLRHGHHLDQRHGPTTPRACVPLPNVYVYVPSGTPATLLDGATCDKCGSALSAGLPLVTTITDATGKFKLDNMPVGAGIPVVIQIGKWRRQITVTTTQCVNTAVAAALTRLPRNKTEGDIPKMALTTGGADALQCLLRKIGIDDSEFTNPSGTGRINLFAGKPGNGQVAAATSDAAYGGALPARHRSGRTCRACRGTTSRSACERHLPS
jgi:hypothetical protein